MAAGTPTLSDSYWLAQSGVFKNRVASALFQTCANISSEAVSGVTGTMPNSVHLARKGQVANILNPANFTNWLTQFTMACANDTSTGGVIQLATASATAYLAITSGANGDSVAADGQTPQITTAAILNACSAAFNQFIGGI